MSSHRRKRIEDEAPELEASRTEVDQQAELYAARFEVVQELCYVLSDERLCRLDLDHEAVVNEQVGVVLAYEGPVLVVDGESLLLLDVETLLPKPVRECILVHLLEEPPPKVAVGLEGRLPDETSELLVQ